MLFRTLISKDAFSITSMKGWFPRFARSGNRWNFIFSFLYNLFVNAESYFNDRILYIFKANSTSQILVFENLLNEILDPTLRRIYIAGNTNTNAFRVAINKLEDSSIFGEISNESEGSFEAVPLLQESTGISGFNFIVYYPSGIDTVRLETLINNYAIAGVSHAIQEI